MALFIDEIAEQYNIDKDSLVYEYIVHKTKAHDRGSKARRSLGNLYALYVLCEAYVNGHKDGSRFTDLLARMKSLPFGSKLQNHPLDNRLNNEVERKCKVADKFLPVQEGVAGGMKARKISEEFLSQGGNNPENAANFILDVVNEYIEIINTQQNEYLEEIEESETDQEIYNTIVKAFAYESDARLFEIVSHAILYVYYKSKVAYVGDSPQTITAQPLTLYKTGRTNANDGGIDFVLKPYGRFYQVTETLDFKKYFLDLDKMSRFAITFVIKTDKTVSEVLNKIRQDANKAMDTSLVERYMGLFEEVITLNELNSALNEVLQSGQQAELKQTVIDNYKLEYGMLD
ncbi:hypothetical protein KW479_12890 [Vibrio fluvialis]|nr:hypothetical protein [Vibrio fluvialis]